MDQAALPNETAPNETADVIAEIWCEVLEFPEVEMTSNFFDLGGHSILLHMVRDRIEQRLGRKVELIDLFQHPTVASLAQYIDSPAQTGADSAGTGSQPRRSRAGGPDRLTGRRARLTGGGAVGTQPQADAESPGGDR